MYNYHHEIEMPKDRLIRYFLWSDFFHDSTIHSIDYVDSNKKERVFIVPTGLKLTLVCDREFRETHHLDDVVPTRKQYQTYLTDPRDQYTYELYFDDCQYFNHEESQPGNEYLNGRFKDSALLRQIIRKREKDFYHLRIQTSGGSGYLDIIFRKLRIKKQIGKVKIEDVEDYDGIKVWADKKAERNNDGDIDINKILITAAAASDSGKDEDDVLACYALDYLARFTNCDLIDIARKILKQKWDGMSFRRISTVWILGKQGDESNLPLLWKEYSNQSGNFCAKRHIMDAIDRIHDRTANSNDAKYSLEAL